MPLPALAIYGIGAGVSAGLGLYQNWRNKKAQEKQNARDRQFQWDMYWQQRADAEKDWAKMNAYNDPAQQMARLKDAGLNPVWLGKTADNTATMARSASAGSGDQPAPQDDFSSVGAAVSMFAQLAQLSAQTDNLRQQKELIEAQSQQVRNQTALGQFDLSQKLELKDDMLHRYRLENQAIQQGMDIALDDYQLRALQTSQNVELTINKILESQLEQQLKQQQFERNPLVNHKLTQEIALLETAVSNAKKEGRLKDALLKLKEMGINEGDHVFLRWLIQLLQ